MAAYIFDNILRRADRQGIVPNETKKAREWFRQSASKTRVTSKGLMEKNATAQVSRPTIGKMYSFFYDPKHKKTLPYYDRFPLVFPFDSAPKGFYGLNMHYLPPRLRAKLMDSLYNIVSDDKFNERTRLDLSYEILEGSARFKWFKPCVKRYLNSHVRSKFLRISPKEWDIALFLPTARWQKATEDQVWRDSRRMLR
jgi:hypothetical protein